MSKRVAGLVVGIAWLAVVVPVGVVAAADKEELKLDLPRAMFIGTPRDIASPNLEPKPKDEIRAPFLVPRGTRLLSSGKPVTSSDPAPIIGELEQVTDGDKEAVEGSAVELGPGSQWVQIDLEETCRIYAIVVWHFHSQARIYRDVIIQTAGDPDFILDVKTVYNNDHDNSSGLGVGKQYEYVENNQGRLMPIDGVEGRYVRFYSNGSTSDELNHYTEVEIFGIAEQDVKEPVAAADADTAADAEPSTGPSPDLAPRQSGSPAEDASSLSPPGFPWRLSLVACVGLFGLALFLARGRAGKTDGQQKD